MARSAGPDWLAHMIRGFQGDLYLAMSDVAAGSDAGTILTTRLGPDDVGRLDATLADLRARTSLKPAFIIPGDTPLGAMLDLARAVVRRAERRVAQLAHAGALANEHLLPYLNRLSDVLFVAARLVEATATVADPGPLGAPPVAR